MALEQREPWIAKTLEWEGGAKYTNRKEDRGGPTRWGVTMPALAKWRHVDKVAPEDIAQLKQDEAEQIFRADYWGAVNGDKLPPGIDWCVATIAVLSGPVKAAKLLQDVVGAKIDGYVGERTLSAVRAMRPMDVLLKLQGRYLEFLVRIPGEANDAGWMDRWTECLAIAEVRIDHSPTASLVNGSRTIKAGGAAALIGSSGIWAAVSQYGGPMVEWARDRLSDPAALDKLQDAAAYAGANVSPPAIILMLSGALAITTAGCCYAIWRRFHMEREGRT